MLSILFMLLEAILSAIVLLPFFWLLNKQFFHSCRRTGCYLLLASYLAAVYCAVGLPTVTYIRFDLHFNFVPFAYMFSDLRSTSLNVLLFLPLGFFLPVLWSRFRGLSRTLLFGFCTSLLIELLQIFTFRATDINDLMTNTLGTLLGWCIGRLVLKYVPAIRPSWKTREVFWILGLSFGVMFFLQPFFESLILFILY